jgi:glycosyltransferase involved in cell wall biosynthesis
MVDNETAGGMNTRITILAARYYPETHGGVETHMLHFSHELARQGVATCVMTENRAGAAADEMLAGNLRVVRGAPADPGRLWRWMPLVQMRWWHNFLRKHPPRGEVWATNPMIAAAAVLAGLRDRMVYNPAACIAGMRHIGRLYPHITTMQLSRMTACMDRFAYRRAARVIISSRNVRDQYRRHYGPRDRIIVNPLATATPTHTSKRDANDTFVIGSVGRLDPCKGLDMLFDAVALAGVDRVRLLIVGDGPDRQRLEQRAKSSGVADRITWTGRLNDPSAAYAKMDVLALPSVYEAFGLVALEAMAHGVPVLARRGDGRSVLTASDEIVQHHRTGLLFDSHHPYDLACCIRLLADHDALRRRMAIDARRHARTMNWPAHTQRVIDWLALDARPAVRLAA